MDNAEFIKQQAQSIGFDLCGIAPAVGPASWPDFTHWLDAGFAGEMHYLEKRRAAYQHPRFVLESVRSVIMVAVCYDPQPEAAGTPSVSSVGRIARYARGLKDYHDVLRSLLKRLADKLHAHVPGCRTRGVVDTAPLLERDFARQAGLGWFGKNTMLINKHKGSYFFLGAILTDLELPPDMPHETSHCGTCTRCLEICPTDALVEPYRLDARRCLSYLTIELRDQPIPLELRSQMGDWMFGCDLCQQVCPWNRHAPLPRLEEFVVREQPATAREILALGESAFREKYRETPLARPGWQGMARNAAIVLGNQGNAGDLALLRGHLQDGSPLVRGACVWAIAEIGGDAVAEWLTQRAAIENDPEVHIEIQAALRKLGNLV